MRTGIYENKNTAHKVIPLIKEWGVGAMTVSYSSHFCEFFLFHFYEIILLKENIWRYF